MYEQTKLSELKEIENVKKAHMLMISHSHKDREIVGSFVNLIEDVGVPEEEIVCTSLPGQGIPIGGRVYDWLKIKCTENDMHVIFLLSSAYYQSPACLNEMGAAWMVGMTHTTVFLPGFDAKNIEGCLDSSEVGISLSDEEDIIRYRLNELKTQLIREFSLPELSQSKWTRYRESFIEKICTPN